MRSSPLARESQRPPIRCGRTSHFNTRSKITYSGVYQIRNRTMPLKCKYPDCGEEAEDNVSLSAHVQVAHQHNKLACQDCGTKTKSPSTLRTHRVRHEDPNRYRCPFCNRGFFRRDQYGTHVVGAHEGRLKELIASGATEIGDSSAGELPADQENGEQGDNAATR
ncbi:hypothetical protein B0J18DRAFT_427022 [Chaetomium sp. MPI-SDFR-AT-0129]|nr:hypothetical protein B0J18DRAFT_427022 [Chaetomium sp. MPI-SDFR-AT-0129]